MQALKAKDVPVKVLGPLAPLADLHRVALARSDQVTVTTYVTVSGLERRVVIGMGETVGSDRLMAMSRCTAQLVWIDQPAPD